MKLTILFVVLVSMLFAGNLAAQAQSYTIPSFTIDGGGGTSSGGSYTLSGTIGQPDAGALTGGSYKLVGGFWNDIITIPIPGGVTLTLRRSGTTVIIAWPSSATGFVVEATESLSAHPVAWVAVQAPVVASAGEQAITVTASTRAKFYRLRMQ